MSDPAAAMYPNMSRASGVAVVPAAAPAPPDPAPPEPDRVPAAAVLFADAPPTRGFVKWTEPAAAPGEINLPTWDGYEATDGDLAERRKFSDALATIGVGRSFADEIWSDLGVASRVPIRTSIDDAMMQLRRVFGSQTDAKVAAAIGVVDQFERLYPGAKQKLAETGLGNSPEFIRKLARFAEKRR